MLDCGRNVLLAQKGKNEIMGATQRLGRTIWKKWSGYLRRRLVEKNAPPETSGERIVYQDFDRQVAELQLGAALLNLFTQLGTSTTFTMA